MRPRKHWVDLINVCAIPLVVFLHLRTFYWRPAPTGQWWTENLISGIGVAAVPLFLMNSGATMLDFAARSTLREFFTRRFVKILIPYAVWTEVYLFAGTAMKGEPTPGPGRMLGILGHGSSVAAPFWYVEALLGIYLVIPFFALAVQGVKAVGWDHQRFCWFLAVVGGMGPVLLPYLRGIWPSLSDQLQVPLGGYLGFVLLGYALSQLELGRVSRGVFACLGILGYLGFVLVGGRLMLDHGPSGDAALYTGYLTPTTVLIAASLMVGARSIDFSRWPDALLRGLQQLAGLTFGTFLLHQLLIDVLRQWQAPHAVGQVLLGAVIVWVATTALVWVLRLVPPVRKWLLP